MIHIGFYFDERLKIVVHVKILYTRFIDSKVTNDIQKIKCRSDSLIQKLYQNFSDFDVRNGKSENYYILYLAPRTKDKNKFLLKNANFHDGKIFKKR